MGLPEVFYGNNHIYFINGPKNLLFEICPLDAVSYSSFAKRDEYLRPASTVKSQALVGDDEKVLNLIDLVPKVLVVAQTDIWKKKDTSKIKDFTTVEVISDWTFSTPYKGSVRFLTNHVKKIKEQTSLDLHSVAEGADKT